MTNLASTRTERNERGFSLIEMAVVMMIMGLLLGGLFTAIGQSTENTRRTDTLAQLELIEEALYGYAQAYGRLPCPATNVTAGVEAPAVPLATGICTVAHGFVPHVTLGIQSQPTTNGLLVDAWRNPIRYSVSILDSGANRVFTSTLGMRAQFASATPIAPNVLTLPCITDAPACAGVVHANTVPALAFSMGNNALTTTSADELENVGAVLGLIPVPGDNEFVSDTYSEANYDDLMIWLSPNVLFSRLVTAGRLP
jgi:prepilin-type N-terminal cleavage/methylation domain-containing protein